MKKQKVKCFYCEGTGVYKGCHEREGSAVECSYCDGNGYFECDTVEVEGTLFAEILASSPHTRELVDCEIFIEKVERKGIEKVFPYVEGFIYNYSCTDKTDEVRGLLVQFSKGGVSYEEWLKGAKALPVPVIEE